MVLDGQAKVCLSPVPRETIHTFT